MSADLDLVVAGKPRVPEARIPRTWLRSAEVLALSPGGFRVWVVLWSYADSATGEAWPLSSTLQKDTGASRATVFRALAELRDAGLLTTERRDDGASRLQILHPPPSLTRETGEGGGGGRTTATPPVSPVTPRTTQSLSSVATPPDPPRGGGPGGDATDGDDSEDWHAFRRAGKAGRWARSGDRAIRARWGKRTVRGADVAMCLGWLHSLGELGVRNLGDEPEPVTLARLMRESVPGGRLRDRVAAMVVALELVLGGTVRRTAWGYMWGKTELEPGKTELEPVTDHDGDEGAFRQCEGCGTMQPARVPCIICEEDA